MRRQQRATRGGSEDPEDGGSDPTRGGRVRSDAASRREQRTPKSEERRSEGEGVEVVAVRREDGDGGSVVVCGHGGGGPRTGRRRSPRGCLARRKSSIVCSWRGVHLSNSDSSATEPGAQSALDPER